MPSKPRSPGVVPGNWGVAGDCGNEETRRNKKADSAVENRAGELNCGKKSADDVETLTLCSWEQRPHGPDRRRQQKSGLRSRGTRSWNDSAMALIGRRRPRRNTSCKC